LEVQEAALLRLLPVARGNLLPLLRSPQKKKRKRKKRRSILPAASMISLGKLAVLWQILQWQPPKAPWRAKDGAWISNA
jgi:hypothetical protein